MRPSIPGDTSGSGWWSHLQLTCIRPSHASSRAACFIINRRVAPYLSQLKQSRRLVADLLRNNKAESARIRVESVMREEQMLQAYEGTVPDRFRCQHGCNRTVLG